MSNLNPEVDNFTKSLNKTVPAVTGNLSPLVRKAQTTSSISSVAADILNKIQGSLNVFTSIKTGSFFSFNTIKSFDLSSFFEGPSQNLGGKINNVASSFNDTSKLFQSQNLKLENKNLNLLNKLDKQQLDRFESTKIAKAGFNEPLDQIKNLSNKQIVEFNLDPKLKLKFELETAAKANENLINSALNQKPLSELSSNQDKLINKAEGLINIKELNEIKSPYEII